MTGVQTCALPIYYTVRKISLGVCDLIDENDYQSIDKPELIQTDFFTNYAKLEQQKLREERDLRSEKELQKAVIQIRKRYGKNAILRGTNFEDGATQILRHRQIGGHRA